MRIFGTGPFTRAHLAWVTVVTLLSLACLAALAATSDGSVARVAQRHAFAFGTFLAMAVLSRLLAFRVAGTGAFALDTSVYVAALLTLGGKPAVAAVLVSMLLRGSVEWVRRELDGTRWPLAVSVVRLLFGPAVTAAVLAGVGLVADPEVFTRQMRTSVPGSVAVFLGATAAFVLPQFALVLMSYRLNGIPWRTLGRDVAGPGLLGEAAFVPMGYALAFSYRDGDPPTLGAVAVSYVIFAYVFRRMWRSRESLRQQARELEMVEEAGRAVASTLDVEEIGRRMGMSLLAAIDRAAGVVLTVAPGDTGAARHLVRALDRRQKPAVVAATRRSLRQDLKVPDDRLPAGGAEEAPEATGPAFSLALPSQESRPEPGWLTVVMRPGTAATAGDRRLAGLIARQAGAAVENWRLYTMATEDGLTRLFVRRYLEARLREEFERSSRSGASFCLLMIDVDNLKVANDRHGHGAGDRLLKAVAAGIRASVRGMDVPGRWGGDEFAVMLPDMGPEEGLATARRISDEVARRSFQVDGTTVVPGVSIGVAAHPACGAPDPAALVAAADTALYEAKRGTSKGGVVAACAGGGVTTAR